MTENTAKPNTRYQKIYLPLPEIMGQGQYQNWKPDAIDHGYTQNAWDTNFAGDTEVHISVSNRFEGKVTDLLLWIEALFKDRKILNGRGEFKAVIIEITKDVSDISVEIFDRERDQATGLVAA